MANSKKNNRCPLQQECGRKCEYEHTELECDYYAVNGIGDNAIPDQEEIRRMREEKAEYDRFEKEMENLEDDGGIVWIDINRLHPHPDNPRKDLGDLTELADSIKAKGVLQNLTVVRGHRLSADERKALNEKYNENPTEELRVYINKGVSQDDFTVIIGHRRTEAARLAGLSKLPCIITEMTPAEQVQTMLLENMQRSDLTVYEQAQGFQMMFDFGDTIDSISEKTGFSKTTVRRRLKMAELDQTALKKVAERQISLLDFDKLSQIDDLEKRNELLSDMGTANFERSIKNALDEQKRKKYEKEWRGVLLEKGLKELDYSETFTGEYKSCEKKYVNMGTVAATEYVFTGDEMYFSISYGTVYFRKDKSPEDNRRSEEDERKAAVKREKEEKLSEATERAYSLRHDFVFSMSETEAKKNIATIIEFDIRRDWDSDAQGGYYMRYDHEDYAQRALSNEDGYHTIAGDVQNSPYKSFLRHVYTRYSDSGNLGYYDWNNNYDNEGRLDLIYDFLMKLGYEMSDEEKELKDGTSALFADADIPTKDNEEPGCGGVCDCCEIKDSCPDAYDGDEEEMTKEDIAAALEEKYGVDDDE